MRAVSVFHIPCRLTKAELLDRFSAHDGPDRFETERLHFVACTADGLDPASPSLAPLLRGMPGCNVGSLALFRRMYTATHPA